MSIEGIAQRVRAWRRYRQSIRELSRLSDRQLQDLGLFRSISTARVVRLADESARQIGD
jgi:Domain of unknown function (DUF1127)